MKRIWCKVLDEWIYEDNTITSVPANDLYSSLGTQNPYYEVFKKSEDTK